MLGSNEWKIGIERNYFFEQVLFERHADGKQRIGFAKPYQLPGRGFIGMRRLSLGNQRMDVHQIAGYGLGEPLLRQDTDKYGRFFRTLGALLLSASQ